MSEIYERATGVITYLGPAVEGDEETQAIKLLRRLYLHFAPNYQLLFECGGLLSAFERSAEFPVTELPAGLGSNGPSEVLKQQGWKRLVEIVFGEWAERLWIVQEQLQNQQGLMLRGPRVLPWAEVVVMPLLFQIRLLPYNIMVFFAPRPSPWDITGPLYAIWRYRMTVVGHAVVPKEQLLINMYFYDTLRCRDPRDHIYALLAVSADSTDLGIDPDYSDSNPADRLYHQVSVRMLRSRSDLIVLSCACKWYNTTGSAVSSWVLNPPPRLVAVTTNLLNNAPHPQHTLSSSLRFCSDDSVLVVKGRCIDAVATSASPLYHTDQMLTNIRNGDFV
jgi:hypothetical protein